MQKDGLFWVVRDAPPKVLRGEKLPPNCLPFSNTFSPVFVVGEIIVGEICFSFKEGYLFVHLGLKLNFLLFC